MMKMMTTLVREARSLDMTRSRVVMAGAWMLSFRIHSTQNNGVASLSACTEPLTIPNAGSTATRPISPLMEIAQRSRAWPSDRPA